MTHLVIYLTWIKYELYRRLNVIHSRKANEPMTPAQAYRQTRKVYMNVNMRRKGVNISTNSKKDAAMLYHAARYFNLKVIAYKYKGREQAISPFIKMSRRDEWKSYLKKLERIRKDDPELFEQEFSFNPSFLEESTVENREFSRSHALRELNNMTGLRGVKSQINDMADYLSISVERKKNGLPVAVTGQHLVFTGNPGTGKTTIARLVGRIYRDLGVLKKGHFTEVGGRDLIAEYIGQTAAKTAEIIEKAIDGILFIDEAYVLVAEGTSNDFGHEAVATLLRYMEDYRDRLVVIVAGYNHEMNRFLGTNPGLRSRFKTKIDFQDYDKDELFEIFDYYCRNESYCLSPDAEERTRELCEQLDRCKGTNFGNGRTVRNAFEKTIMKQSRRLASGKRPRRDDLVTFTAEDIPGLKEFDW